MSTYRISLSYNGFQCSADAVVGLPECGRFMESFLDVAKDRLCHSTDRDRSRLLLGSERDGCSGDRLRCVDVSCNCGRVGGDGTMGERQLGSLHVVSSDLHGGGCGDVGDGAGSHCAIGAEEVGIRAIGVGVGGLDSGAAGVMNGVVGTSGVAAVKGPNWERNNGWREKKKRAKALRRERCGSSVEAPSVGDAVPVWRRKIGVDVDCLEKKEKETSEGKGFPSGGRVGFFSGCSAEVQAQLRESRARYLIAENNRKARSEEERLKGYGQLSVGRAVRLLRQGKALAKLCTGEDQRGWARTIVSESSASVTSSSGVSLASIAVGEDSVSQVGEKGTLGRKAEYDVKKLDLEDYYERLACYDPADKAHEDKELRDEYGDVFGDPEAVVRWKLRREFFEVCNMGLDEKDMKRAVLQLIGVDID